MSVTAANGRRPPITIAVSIADADTVEPPDFPPPPAAPPGTTTLDVAGPAVSATVTKAIVVKRAKVLAKILVKTLVAPTPPPVSG